MNESSRPPNVADSTEDEIPRRELERWEFAPPLGQDGRRIVKFQFCAILEIACTYSEFLEYVTDRLDQWKRGRYRLTEAVQVISETYPGEVDVRSFRIQLNRAIWQGKLAVRENGIRIDVEDIVSIGRAVSSNPVIEARDLNEWLENEGSVHRISYPYERQERTTSETLPPPRPANATLYALAFPQNWQDPDVVSDVPVSMRSANEITPAERRAQLDITRERGARRRILEKWNDIEKEYGKNIDARNVHRVLRRDKGEDDVALKTVQNHLSTLRREGLIP